MTKRREEDSPASGPNRYAPFPRRGKVRGGRDSSPNNCFRILAQFSNFPSRFPGDQGADNGRGRSSLTNIRSQSS